MPSRFEAAIPILLWSCSTGIPLNDPTNILGGAFDLAAFSLDRVDRIEIVRGPMSVRHGSEGIAGVINIITRKGEGPPEVTVNVLGGSYDTWQLGAGSQGRLKAWHYSANLSHLEVGEQVEKEDLERTSFSFASGVSLGGESALDFHFRLHDRQVDGFPPNGGGPEFSILREPQRSRCAGDGLRGHLASGDHRELVPATSF